ncbi:MAG TPA: glycosyltransferase family 2 protein [Terriglobia bacterium]|nr:glycosyltransferase family 2 protein [Terriglobia bacterium]
MQIVFWLSFAFVFYVYLGYPAVLLIWRRIAPRPVKKEYWEPMVTLVIAAHNERHSIEAKLRNCLALDYPKRKLQIIVSLDGPTDGSEFAVWKYVSEGVEMAHSREHAGKAAALNRALRRATGDIVVFADVRQTLSPNAIRELAASFADESVGAVSGELLLLDESRKEATTEVGLYWRYEKALRSMESEIHSIAGATGAIYAIRRELYEELPEDTILDDVLTPLRIVLRGKRTVFEPEAKAYDSVACCPLAEYGRKVRTLCGNYQLLASLPQAVSPWRNPIFIQFVSHKLGRLLVPWALLALFLTNLFMLRGIYAITFSLQAAWYAFAVIGHFLSRREVTAPIVIAAESKRAA